MSEKKSDDWYEPIKKNFERLDLIRWRKSLQYGPPAPEPKSEPDRYVDTTNGMWAQMGDEMSER